MDTNPTMSVIALNVSGLNAPIKRQRLSEWIKRQHPNLCCLQEIHFQYKDTLRLKVNRWRKIYRANINQKKAVVLILISDGADFKLRELTRSKESHYIVIKKSILQEDITIFDNCSIA